MPGVPRWVVRSSCSCAVTSPASRAVLTLPSYHRSPLIFLCGDSHVGKTVAQPPALSLLSRLEEDSDRGVKHLLVGVSTCVLRTKHLRLRGCGFVFLSCPKNVPFKIQSNPIQYNTMYLHPPQFIPQLTWVAWRFDLFKVSWQARGRVRTSRQMGRLDQSPFHSSVVALGQQAQWTPWAGILGAI